MDSTLLQIDRLTVEFPGVLALDEVHFDIAPGEVHALVGENGAGKSTLLKVLGGLHRPSAGEIRLGGQAYRPRRPADALRAGIAVIYQEFNLYPDLTVAENVFSGREPFHPVTRGIRYAEINRRSAALFDILGVAIDPTAAVGELTVAEQQLTEIAKALSVDGRIIVMDEPTAALSGDEVARLLDVVRRLRAEGRSVIYVSHRLDEVFAVADRVTVLRDGRHVRTMPLADTTSDELVRLMVGRDIASIFHRERSEARRDAWTEERSDEGRRRVEARESGATQKYSARESEANRETVVLELDRVSAGRRLREISLTVRAGEIVGIGGVAGAGQPELSQVIFGALPLTGGRMTFEGTGYRPANPAEAMARGVGFLHEDRKAAGLLPDLSIRDNLTISVLDRVRGAVARLLSPAAQTAVFAEYSERLGIRATGPDQLIGQLSGGNQQKVLLGRSLAPGGRLLVLNEPTRGVDIGAKAEIHHLINELTRAGTAVLMISSDLPELLGVSDRVYVMAGGEITGHLTGDDRTEENVVACGAAGRRLFSEAVPR